MPIQGPKTSSANKSLPGISTAKAARRVLSGKSSIRLVVGWSRIQVEETVVLGASVLLNSREFPGKTTFVGRVKKFPPPAPVQWMILAMTPLGPVGIPESCVCALPRLVQEIGGHGLVM